MPTYNPFAEEWYACLIAHYRFVVVEQDTSNEASLRGVLLRIGVDSHELDALQYEGIPPSHDAESEINSPPVEEESDMPRVETTPAEEMALARLEAALAVMIEPKPDVSPATYVEEPQAHDESEIASALPSPAEQPPPPPAQDLTQLSLF
ncbi:MAG TPA: hypothetical protein PLD47_09365 [Aggregatilineales bacterium]|nr:hypothetical protein [Anaerolineales bacterium]HRE47922.1 hypothetical protein [Aggregatilineales bacterium]